MVRSSTSCPSMPMPAMFSRASTSLRSWLCHTIGAGRERADERVGITAVERGPERVDHLFVGGHASSPLSGCRDARRTPSSRRGTCHAAPRPVHPPCRRSPAGARAGRLRGPRSGARCRASIGPGTGVTVISSGPSSGGSVDLLGQAVELGDGRRGCARGPGRSRTSPRNGRRPAAAPRSTSRWPRIGGPPGRYGRGRRLDARRTTRTSPRNSGSSSRHSVRSASIHSSARRPRVSNGTPIASYSPGT